MKIQSSLCVLQTKAFLFKIKYYYYCISYKRNFPIKKRIVSVQKEKRSSRVQAEWVQIKFTFILSV